MIKQVMFVLVSVGFMTSFADSFASRDLLSDATNDTLIWVRTMDSTPRQFFSNQPPVSFLSTNANNMSVTIMIDSKNTLQEILGI